MTYSENITTELKREYTPNIIKTVIAFANTNNGKIYIGIEDDGSVVGVDNADEVMLQVTNAVRDSVKPDITLFMTCSTEDIEGKNVVVVDVQKGTSAPYYLSSKGIRPEGVFVRQGASTVPATRTAILNMIKNTAGSSFEEAVSTEQTLTFEYMKRTFKERDVELNDNKMRSMGLINNDKVYTNLALLLSDQCVHTIKIAVFQDETMDIFKNREEFKGSLLEQLDSAYKLLDMCNETKAEFEGLHRIDKRAYPPVAIRETLLNCICHRDYAISSSTLISVFADRMEFLNVGGLVDGISESDIKIGVSALRNKKLADILYRLELIEAYGTGIQKIESSYSRYTVKPQIIISDNAFKVILPNTEYAVSDLSDNEKAVLKYAATNKSFTRNDISDILNLGKNPTLNLLNGMIEKQLLSKTNGGKNTTYTIR